MYDVTPADIREAAFGIDIPAGTEVEVQLEKLIAKAEIRLAAELPGLALRYTSGAIDRDTVASVIEDMVVRVVKNPRSLRSLGLDDFQATIDSSASTGLLYLTPAERALLSAGRGRSGIGTIRVGVPGWRLPGA